VKLNRKITSVVEPIAKKNQRKFRTKKKEKKRKEEKKGYHE
jgi:hypothetical protein